MKVYKRSSPIVFIFVVFLMIAGCTQESDHPETREGGELNIAHNAAPPTLDWHATGATSTRDIAMLVYETLVTVDSEFNVEPMLAESIDESEDGKTYTFNLREGVMFHNGKEMVSEDVVASMERWMERSDITGKIFIDATWETDGDYTVILKLKNPSALTLDTIATTKQAPAIMPKEIIESAPAVGVEEYIGTGPFMFNEWKIDQYIHIEKYDEYKPVDSEPDGWSGKKEALIDDIYFHFVPDTSTRIAGIQTDQYDFGYDIPFDRYEEFLNEPNLDTFIASPGNAVLKFNTQEGLSSDFEFREVINTALNYDDLMGAAFIHEDAYDMTHGYMDPDIINWDSEKGIEYYNINDPDRAKKMLEDIGYDGEEFRILTTRDYDYIYDLSVVVNEQLNNIGINSKLEIYDWPTVSEMTGNKDELDSWDATLSGSGIVSTPPQLISLSESWAGGVNDVHILDTMEALELESDPNKAKELWDELHLYAWEEFLPTIQLGRFNKLYIMSDKISGVDTLVGPIFWNVSINE